MGVLVADEKQFSNGLSLTNFVISIGAKYTVEKTYTIENNYVYLVWYTCYYYISDNAYNQKKGFIESSTHQIQFTAQQISGSIFNAIYAEIKTGYQSTTDI